MRCGEVVRHLAHHGENEQLQAVRDPAVRFTETLHQQPRVDRNGEPGHHFAQDHRRQRRHIVGIGAEEQRHDGGAAGGQGQRHHADDLKLEHRQSATLFPVAASAAESDLVGRIGSSSLLGIAFHMSSYCEFFRASHVARAPYARLTHVCLLRLATFPCDFPARHSGFPHVPCDLSSAPTARLMRPARNFSSPS